MKHLKMLGLAAVAAMAMMAVTAGSASATTLEINGVTQNGPVAFTVSLEPGTTMSWSNTSKSLINTCKKSIFGGTTSTFTGTRVTGALNELTFEECTHNPVTVEVGGLGQLYVEHIPGTTNGTVFIENTKVTLPTTLPGTSHITTVSGAGTHIGTLNGTTSTLEIKAVLSGGFLAPSVLWEGSYSVTTPAPPNKLSVSA